MLSTIKKEQWLPNPKMRVMLSGMFVTLVFLIAISHHNIQIFSNLESYVPVHTALEFVAISIAVMIFTLGWNVRSHPETGYLPIIGSFFLAVAIIDLMHTLSYPGMPAFITPNIGPKAINFWLFARYISALSLIPLALQPNFRNPSNYFSVGSLFASITYTILVFFVVVDHADWLPEMYSAANGLSVYKIASEASLSFMFFLSAALFLRHTIKSRDIVFGWLAAGSWSLGLSEVFFANYETFYDQFGITGHVFKVIGYCMIYRALFVAGVQKPYVTLAKSQREVEDALKDLSISAIAFNVQEGVMITDSNHIILRINKAFTEFTGYSQTEVIGQHADMLNSPRHTQKFYQNIKKILLREKFWSGEVWDKRRDNSLYPKWLNISAVTDATGEITNYVSAFSDISKFKEAQSNIHQLAYYDQLTNLPNRRLLLDRLKQAIILTTRNHHYGAVLSLDLDHFKAVNDIRGHEFGDALLIEAAIRIKGCVRASDTVARLESDEFVVLLEGLDQSKELAAIQADLVASKICEVISEPYFFNDFNHHCTTSVGVTLFHNDECTLDDLLIRAEIALHQAKMSGRNNVSYFDVQMQESLAASALMESDLQQALTQGEFQLYYQMQVDDKHHIFGAEVLIRWLHPTRGLVSPAEFIPIIERNGLILSVGSFVLETACHQLYLWQDNPATNALMLSVNVSAKQFRQPDFVQSVKDILTNTNANPARLKLELTESIVLDNVQDTVNKMHELKAMGISFSMDDFGTGYSSLSHIKLLPLDQLKIDQSFVRELMVGSSDAIIVKTIIAMADALNLNVIAEGVETEEQLRILREFNCMSYQGYLFGKPVPLDSFYKALESTLINPG